MRGTNLARPKSTILAFLAPGHEDVGRLDIAMNDSLFMRGVEGVGNVDGNLEQLFERERPLLDEALQGFAIEEFHGNKQSTVGFGDLMNGKTVWAFLATGPGIAIPQGRKDM